MDNQKKLIEEMFKKGILVSQDLLDKELDQTLYEKIKQESDIIVLNEDYSEIINSPGNLVDWYELDGYRVKAEKDRDDNLYQTQLQQFRKVSLSLNLNNHSEIKSTNSDPDNSDFKNSNLDLRIESSSQEISSPETELRSDNIAAQFETEEHLPLNSELSSDQLPENQEIKLSLTSDHNLNWLENNSPISVVLFYENIPHKYTIQDFANFFTSRYKYLGDILRNRAEMANTLTINRIITKKDRENVSLIGVVEEIGETKNGNLIITLEDLTGKIKVLISKNNRETFKESKDIVVDEVIGVTGVCGDKIIFAENIFWPDIPLIHELKKGPEEEYAIFLSDIHVGSKLFLRSEFKRFLRWIRGEMGNDLQKEMAKKVKYIFIAGDLVDGVGIYPSQEEELEITNLKEQYLEFCRLIKQIPADKKIIICPGNHDVIHLAEPQSVFYKNFIPELYSIPNVTLVSNPAVINIGKSKTFSGFNVLMYHGFSFDYYVANVESIRMGGGYHRSDLIMKFLLKRRHLAPSFTSTPYYPAHIEDPLLIKIIPDIFITGHIHYSCVANYKGVTMISGSCWQSTTTFQEKLGHQPEPARVPVVNLKTREVKILRFDS
ncbi:MAG TPA: DNA-directed DNA polymerase II small subunit [Candidatus Nanoarchaeia archaeon]|nr:DNA-directed DNA polymerase II small subunit [Candidatus Nanoarchaeia archaeon]